MRAKLQLVMCSDDGREETVTDIVTLKKDATRIEHLGLTLAEAKQLPTTIQHRVLQHQVEAFLASHSTCADCGAALKVKGSQTRSFRTLFGTFKLASPRLFHCRCQRRKKGSGQICAKMSANGSMAGHKRRGHEAPSSGCSQLSV